MASLLLIVFTRLPKATTRNKLGGGVDAKKMLSLEELYLTVIDRSEIWTRIFS